MPVTTEQNGAITGAITLQNLPGKMTRNPFKVFVSSRSKQRTRMVSTVKSHSACLVLNLKNRRLPLEILNTLLNGKVFRLKKKKPTAQPLPLPF